MSVESQSRIPQEGTNAYRVLMTIQKGTPEWDTRTIAQHTGLRHKLVANARNNLRRDGYLPRPTPELIQQTRSQASAKVFPLIQEYRDMGFSPREIQFAVKLEKKTELSYNSAHKAVINGTKKGKVRNLSKEEMHDIRVDLNLNTPEEAFKNVAKILKLRKWLSENNLPLPTNRLEWKKAVEEYLYKSRNLPLPSATDTNKKDMELVKMLIFNEFIERDDLSFFERLKKLYKNRYEEFEEFPPEIKIRLEAFTVVIIREVEQGKTDLKDKFIELGMQFGKEWFLDRIRTANQEQRFIADRIRSEKI